MALDLTWDLLLVELLRDLLVVVGLDRIWDLVMAVLHQTWGSFVGDSSGMNARFAAGLTQQG